MFQGFLVVAGLVFTLVGPLVYAGPQLASDLSVGREWTSADDLAIQEFRCTRWYFLVSTCSVQYVSRGDPARSRGALNYVVFESWSGEHASLLRSASDPSRLGTTLGIERMQQRLVASGVFAALTLALIVAMLGYFLQRPRSVSAPVDPVGEQPVPSAGAKTFGRRTSRA